jgi:hypothetical protein
VRLILCNKETSKEEAKARMGCTAIGGIDDGIVNFGLRTNVRNAAVSCVRNFRAKIRLGFVALRRVAFLLVGVVVYLAR